MEYLQLDDSSSALYHLYLPSLAEGDYWEFETSWEDSIRERRVNDPSQYRHCDLLAVLLMRLHDFDIKD